MYAEEYTEAELKQIGVYRIITPGGGVYIGMTTIGFQKRWNNHHKDLKSGKHPTTGLKNAFNKYNKDWNLFTLEIIKRWNKTADKKELLELEKEIISEEKLTWIRHKNSGYNMLHGCPTGTGSVIHTIETRKRIGESSRKNHEEKIKNGYFNSKTMFTDEEIDLIKTDYENGKSIKSISLKYCKNPSSVSKIIKNKDFKLKDEVRNRKIEESKNNRDLNYANLTNKYSIEKFHFEDGLTHTEIGVLTGFSSRHIGRIIDFIKRTKQNLDDSKARERIIENKKAGFNKLPKLECNFCNQYFKKNVIKQHEKACLLNPINFDKKEKLLTKKCCFEECKSIISSKNSKTCKDHNNKSRKERSLKPDQQQEINNKIIYTNHINKHVDKEMINPNCKFCVELNTDFKHPLINRETAIQLYEEGNNLKFINDYFNLPRNTVNPYIKAWLNLEKL